MSRLYRSRSNRVVGGVAGGLGEYFRIDPVIVRLVWVLLAFARGSGLMLYLIAWILIPEEPIVVIQDPDSAPSAEASGNGGAGDWSEQVKESPVEEEERRRRWFGGLLVIAGLLLLAEKTALWLDPAWLVPLGLIAAGVVVLVRGRK